MKKIKITIMMLLFIVLGACQDNDRDELSEMEEYINGSIELVAGENTLAVNSPCHIRLSESGSTGYSWHYTIQDTGIIDYSEDKTFDDMDPLIAGNSVDHVWKFSVKTRGTTQITFKLYFDSEEEAETIKLYTITVI